LEADDLMAILQTKDTVICTIDKDLLQVEGWHYQWELRGTSVNGKEWVKEARFFEQTELDGTRLFYEQCLKGDASDNVKGVSGIGEGKARKLLANCNSEIEFVNVCLEHYPSEEEFLMNAQCLYILRSLDDSYLTRYERITNENNSNET
jgi:DNA polymerase-1